MMGNSIKLLFVLFIIPLVLASSYATTIYVPGNYAKIQSAINNATAGDIIIVSPGTYKENVVVNKSITLKCASPPACIIDGRKLDAAIKIVSSNAKVIGFTAFNSTSTVPVITTFSTSNVLIKDVVVYGGGYGISGLNVYNLTIDNATIHNIVNYGIRVGGSVSGFKNSTIENCDIFYNLRGISGGAMMYSIIKNNKIHDNTGIGIYLTGSTHNKFIDNEIYNNGGNGMDLSDRFDYNNISYNKIYGNNGAAGIEIHSNCSYNVIYNNEFYHDYRGIWIFKYQNYTKIINNYIHDNRWNGVVVDWYSHNNYIANNIVINCSEYGIRFVSSSYNNLAENNTIKYCKAGGYIMYHVHGNNTMRYSTLIGNKIGLIIISAFNSSAYGLNIENSTQNNAYIGDSNNMYIQYNSSNPLLYDIVAYNCTGCEYKINNLDIIGKYVKFKIVKDTKRVVDFNATSQVEGTVVKFRINNLFPKSIYSLYIDGKYIRYYNTGKDGVINFAYNSWSNHDFRFVYSGSANSENNKPVNINPIIGFYTLLKIVSIILWIIVLVIIVIFMFTEGQL